MGCWTAFDTLLTGYVIMWQLWSAKFLKDLLKL